MWEEKPLWRSLEVALDEENATISQDDDDGGNDRCTVSRENFETAAPSTASQHDAVHHGVACDASKAVMPASGSVLRRPWIVTEPVEQQIAKGHCSLEMGIMDYFPVFTVSSLADHSR